ncbi:hypothetical protein KW791_02530, partial [Candidatus Parcubacteria bacterium]|nr:hypothetical protein [Candidatus Parcubacteria bacterium]
GERFKNKTVNILLGGFLINLLPFIGIGRVMFLYHYLAAYIFAILALAYLIGQMKNKKSAAIAVAIAAVVFVYFAPLNYGLHLSSGQFNARMWLSTWR